VPFNTLTTSVTNTVVTTSTTVNDVQITSTDTPYSTRIDDFTFTRNHELENIVYQNFINKYGKEYILYHEVVKDQAEIIKEYGEPKKTINLNRISDTFFDMISILENALEIHLLDSVWGAFVYQLNAKYKLFKHKKIN
jgi:hypothetical protein